jgi:hypothetical protein
LEVRQNADTLDVYPESRIPDPIFSFPDPGSRVYKILDPGSASKNLSFLTPKKMILKNKMWDVHSGS